MHLYRTGSQPSKAPRNLRGALRASLCAAVVLGGCAKYTEPLELNPSAWAPQAVQREWAPTVSQHGLVSSAAEAAMLSDRPSGAQRLGLTELIGYALANNPSTRSAWRSAEAAAAAAGKARAPYYPIVSAHSDNGYQRLVDLVPKHWGALKTWQSRNILSLDYDLIDFGRRDAASNSALNELVAANLLFNRKVQEVVFNVERSFYELDAAHAPESKPRTPP
jgi:outer membrane protein TolC